MKLLIYGLDGGDLEIMNIFKDQMPFFQNFLNENENIELSEDLINRGWVEILTGKYGSDTRGFYMAPKLDGTRQCSTSFNMKAVEGDENIIPLWELAERRKIPYFIMNVPTTTPVPETTYGIVVGSAGGGLNKIEGIPEILVSDTDTRKFLEENDYIVDVRIPNDEIQTTEELFEQVSEKELKRTKCFIELSKKNNIEFGFLVNRGNTIVQYLCRSVIEDYKESLREGKKCDSWVVPYLERHFKELDLQIESLFKELSPEHFILTADHNIVPSKYWANANIFLKENGFLKAKKGSKGIDLLKKFAKKMLGSRLKQVSKSIKPEFKNTFSEYDWNSSVAFGHTYIPGIFINDKKRFNGPVKVEDINKVVDQICSVFNNIPKDERMAMTAIPYRSQQNKGKFWEFLPDIKFQGSEGIFFHEKITQLIFENPNYGPIPKQLSKVTHAAFSGDKGANPVCVMTKKTKEYISEKQKKDLTLIYKLVNKIL